jgi:hypothetical protein
MFQGQPSKLVEFRIALRPVKDVPQVLFDASNSPHRISLEEVMGIGQFSADPVQNTFEIKIDTGAVITVIAPDVWKVPSRFKQIKWLHEPGVDALSTGQPAIDYSFRGVGGSSIRVILGRVRLRCFPVKAASSSAIENEITAAFELYGKCKCSLLGLGGQAFQGGGLCLNGNTSTVHLLRI